jgi:hypothetical protein
MTKEIPSRNLGESSTDGVKADFLFSINVFETAVQQPGEITAVRGINSGKSSSWQSGRITRDAEIW